MSRVQLRVAALAALIASPASAVEPHRSFYDLPSSNGYGAVVVDLQTGKPHHLRDHLFATEEPRIDATGADVWTDGAPSFPEVISSRDLLFDAYFGIAVDGVARWLPSVPVDLDASGWDAPDGSGPGGGTNVIRMVQHVDDVRVTTYVWAPWGLARAASAFVAVAENTGQAPVSVQLLSLQNLHLGEGRPGPTQEIGAQNETIVLHDGSVEERGFAGVVATRPLVRAATSVHWAARGGTAPFAIVDGGSPTLPAEPAGTYGPHDDNVAYFSWDATTLAPGESAAAGFVLAHHGDPFAHATVDAELSDWIEGLDPPALLARERAQWAEFQSGLTVPDGLTADEVALYRHSAVVLRMAQVRETSTYLREWLTRDREPRYSRFGELPAEVEHAGAGAVLASLPPGQWGYAWPRDSAYAVVGMALAGMHDEARAALQFQLDAVTDLYRSYSELDGLPIVPYSVSLCRHHGFGVEESDTLGDGDFNFEFDGAGLYLWSLGEYVRITGDQAFVADNWDALRDRVAGFLLPLIDDDGIIEADSSIWETHWFGKERHWAYTTITASRGLCEAARLAPIAGDDASAVAFEEAAETLRSGLARFSPGVPVIASNTEEALAALQSGGLGYADGAVIEAVSMGLIDPEGELASNTLAFLDTQLRTVDGPGLIRNDDFTDELGLSPWGSVYDASEWVVIDLRRAVAAEAAGDTQRAEELREWVRAQSAANFLAIGETYDPVSGDYTNNAPMVGFGAGAWIIAAAQKVGDYTVHPACDQYLAEEPEGDDDDAADDDDATDDDDAITDDDDSADDGSDLGGCACDHASSSGPAAGLLLLLGIAGARRNRYRIPRDHR